MDKLLAEVKSSRVWALVIYIGLIVANAAFDLQIDPEALGEVALVVGAFILGKSIRDSLAGSMLKGLVGQAMDLADKHVPNITEDDKPDTT
tara:strand:+ start:771 stop:1043 length:273 start_codon:yes stop_codon:yes gene_type:complete